MRLSPVKRAFCCCWRWMRVRALVGPAREQRWSLHPASIATKNDTAQTPPTRVGQSGQVTVPIFFPDNVRLASAYRHTQYWGDLSTRKGRDSSPQSAESVPGKSLGGAHVKYEFHPSPAAHARPLMRVLKTQEIHPETKHRCAQPIFRPAAAVNHRQPKRLRWLYGAARRSAFGQTAPHQRPHATTSADAPVALALAPAADSRHIAHKFLLRGEKK